jgi:threonine dehydrogenase-like Zn-dependent dehydrogenase
MKALHFNGKKLGLVDIPNPVPGPEDALIKIVYSGICNTDLEILKGYMKYQGITGHEFVGLVERSPKPEWLNRYVVGEINVACGKCDFCHQGLGRQCPNRSVVGIQEKQGVMADYISLPHQNLHLVPTGLDPQLAVFCEPLAAACEIIEQIDLLSEYQVLLIGDGKLAQLIARVVALHTKNLTVLGKHDTKLALLRKLGIKTVNFSKYQPESGNYHVVIEATGSWDGWEMAVQVVKPRGYIILKSTYAGDHQFNPAPIVINEISIIGSRCGPFPVALKLLSKGQIDPSDLITETYAFADWERAFKKAADRESLKIILEH